MTTTCFYMPLSPSCSDLVVIPISYIDTINTRSRGLSLYWPPIGPLCRRRKISGIGRAVALQLTFKRKWDLERAPTYTWWTCSPTFETNVDVVFMKVAQVTGCRRDNRGRVSSQVVTLEGVVFPPLDAYEYTCTDWTHTCMYLGYEPI